jgi:hypothetical protein
MPSKKTSILLTLLIIAVTAVTAYGGLHFVGFSSISYGSLHASFTVAGYGNSEVSVTLQVEGNNLTAMCENRGGNQAPGQNPVNLNQMWTTLLNTDKNGNADGSLTVDLLPSAKQAGCPNGNWHVVDLYGTLYVDLIAQSGGDIATQSFVCNIDENSVYPLTCNPI